MLQVLKVLKVSPVHKGQQVLLGLTATRVRKVLRVSPVHKGRLEIRVLKVRKG